MRHFVDGLVEQSRRHRLSIELILVEWNPPPARLPLAEALSWPALDDHCQIRIVTVPPELHARLQYAAALPLFQMIAKNVGIRRARGRYVLATNIDILFSDSLMRFLRDDLRPGRLYRADRCDVPTDVPRGVPFDEVLAFCHRQMFRINTIGRTLIKSGNRWRDSRPSRASRLRSGARRLRGRVGRVLSWLRRGLRFVVARVEASARAVAVQIVGMASRAARWPYQLARRVAGLARRAKRKGLRGSLASAPRWSMHVGLAAARALVAWTQRVEGAVRALARTAYRRARGAVVVAQIALRAAALGVWAWRLSVARRIQSWCDDPLFTNACGDFTLLSREDWFRLRGYPEWEMFSWHIDSVLLYQANRSGIREVYAGRARKIFHIEHGRGSGYTPEGVADLFARLDARGVPYLSWPDFLAVVDEMDGLREDGQPVLFNPP